MMNKLIKTSLAVFILLMIATANLTAQETDKEKRKIVGQKITEAIIIDGKLDEPVWREAISSGNFIQINPNDGDSSKFPSHVKILYDSKNLYVGVICEDYEGAGAIRATDMSRDFLSSSGDYFSLAIDGLNDNRNAMYLGTNAYGAQVDILNFDAQFADVNWSGLWKVRTSISNTGWTAEFEIPLSTIRYKFVADSAQSFAINFERVRRKSNEWSVWSSIPRNFRINRMEYAGELTDLTLPKPSSNFRLNPYFVSSYNNVAATKFPEPKFGGELRWGITPNLTADLTVNTDFAQAEVDAFVNNTTRFSVLYPEKRQFFLENASMFGAGLASENLYSGSIQIIPYFSRTTGLNDNGLRLPIDGGIRLVNRSVRHNWGVMGVQQGDSGDASDTHFAVGRYYRNVGKQNRVGGLVATKAVTSSTTQSPYLNNVGAADAFFRFGKAHSLNAMAIYSANEGLNKKGTAAYTQYQYISNTLRAWMTEAFISENYSAEMGFVSRSNVLATIGGFTLDIRQGFVPFKNFALAFRPGFSGELYHKPDNALLVESKFAFTPFFLQLVSGGSVGVTVEPTTQNLLKPFSPLGISITEGKYQYTRYRLDAKSDASKKLSYSLKYETGRYYNGSLASTNFLIKLAPIPFATLKLGVNRNEFRQVGVERKNNQFSIYSASGNFAINPRLQLAVLYQKSDQLQLDALNVRFSWEYAPLSFVYLVWNSRIYDALELKNEESAIFKVNFVKQF